MDTHCHMVLVSQHSKFVPVDFVSFRVWIL